MLLEKMVDFSLMFFPFSVVLYFGKSVATEILWRRKKRLNKKWLFYFFMKKNIKKNIEFLLIKQKIEYFLTKRFWMSPKKTIMFSFSLKTNLFKNNSVFKNVKFQK